MGPQKSGIRRRILTLPLVFLAGLVLLEGANYLMDERLRANVVFPEFEAQILSGHRNALQSLVDAEALSLAQAVAGVEDRAARNALIERHTDPQRFFADKTGYFFTYQLDGTRINVPVNKAGNGQKFLDLPDPDGVFFIREMVQKAKAGGGFVAYRFAKPNKGIQPKLSYVKQVEGTDVFVGTGVYIDNVVEEREALRLKLDQKSREYELYKVMLVVAAFGVVLLLSLRIMKEREQFIAGRNRDMKLVLDNVGQGFVVVDPRAELVGERSAIADRWFGAPAPRQALTSWLAPGDARFTGLFELGWEQLLEGLLPREVCLEQLPRRLTRGGTSWSIDYQVLTNEADAITQVMLVLTDISAVLEREAAERSQRETVEVFQRLGRDRAGFLDFVADGRRLVDLLEGDPALSAAEHFRAVHTIKGNAAVHGIHSVAAQCHEVETRLAEDGDRVRPQELAAIRAAWTKLEAQVTRFTGGDRDVVELEGALVRDLEARLARDEPHADLRAAMARWSMEPVRRRLDRLADQASSLALRLGKAPVQVAVTSDGTRLAPGRFGAFWSALVHVVRNAVDHGMEPPDERGDKGQGRITLHAGQDAQGVLEVSLEDDGRGIAWDQVARKAAEKGLPHQTREELVAALFSDGVSTRDVVSETSGRGVGMSAVRDEVHRAGGTFTVTSEPGKGSRFAFRLPL